MVRNDRSRQYLDLNPDVKESGLNPRVHYLLFGWREGRSWGTPRPNSRPKFITLLTHGYRLLSNVYWSQFENSRRRRFPVLLHWLLIGVFQRARLLPSFSISQSGPTVSVTASLGRPAPKVSKLPEEVLSEIYSQLPIEPALAAAGNAAIQYLPVVAADDIFRKLWGNPKGISRVLSKSFDNVILVPHVVVGGADSYLNSLLGELSGRSLLLITLPHTTADKKALGLYSNIRDATVLTLADIMSRPGDDDIVIARVIHIMKPKNLIVINSEIGYRVLAKYGRGLSTHTTCTAIFFSSNPTVFAGQYVNRWLHKFPASIQVVTDNNPALRFIAQVHRGPHFHLPALVEAGSSSWQPDKLAKRNWLWVGRLDEFKGLDLLNEIARLRHLESFSIRGPKPGKDPSSFGVNQANIRLEGPFHDFSDLEISNFDGLVFTSRFEGFPLVVLEALALGLPIVSTDVGGIRDEVGDLIKLIDWEADVREVAANFSLAMNELQSATEQEKLELSTELRHRFESRFSKEIYKSRVEEVFGG
jgi:glycosyltransferase involved in cell wall biosynthesis